VQTIKVLCGFVIAAVVAALVPAAAADSQAWGASISARVASHIEFRAASGTALVIRQPNGKRFRAHLTPARLGGELEVRGYTILRGADRWWRYAAARKSGRLVASRAVVGRNRPPAGLRKGIGRVKPAARLTAKQMASAQLAAAAEKASAITTAEATATQTAVGAGPRTFRFPVLMLATWWDAEAGQTSPQFQPGSDTAQHFRAILDGFGGNPRGSLTEFYFENSHGQFLVQVDVFGPYVSNRSREDRCYYGGIDQPPPDGLDDLDPTDSVLGVGGLGAVGMAVEAVPQADPLVNFASYDNDADGYVDFVGLIHSGADMAVTGDPCNTWSHALPVSAFGDIVEEELGLPTDTIRGGLPTTDGVLVDRVFTMPEFDEKGSSLDIGVATHEMAHALGEPDYYAPNGSSSGDGDWDVMSGGSYMGNPSGSNPAWFNPASRVFQGWVTPTIVHGDLKDYRLKPREAPLLGYIAGTPNPNLLLVPTRWIKVGQTDDDGHTWTERDVYGLVLDGTRGYVVEGWYLEYASRMAGPYGAMDPRMSRSPYFDRGLHGSGLLVWHFDYWRRSNTYSGANDAQNDPNRMQVDVEEFDFYDNTQDIALNLHRGEGSDPFLTTATGVTSGTHQAPPGAPPDLGDPQATIQLSGLTTAVQPADAPFTVDNNPANALMRVRIVGDGPPPGDCKLQLFRRENGELVAKSNTVDSGFVGDEELIVVNNPEPGEWVARVSDFALCTQWTGRVEFEAPGGFDSRGSADTWSGEFEEPTGWAFTNIRAGTTEGLDLGAETKGPNEFVIDILQLSDDIDVSAGYALPAANAAGGRGAVTAGKANAFSVPVFSNGGVAAGATRVTVKNGKTVVADGTVNLGAYERTEFPFTFTPAAEGPYSLTVTVDPANALAEGSESNNAQTATGWSGPANPTVLIVDDEGYSDGEDAYTGALAALGVPYAVASGHVDAATMSQYSGVIWVSSIDRGPGQLDAGDRAAIAEYLGGGGRLWLASNRAAGALETVGANDFLAGWFGADSIETTTFDEPYTVSGTGDALGSIGFTLQAYPVRPFSDVVGLASSGVHGDAAQVLRINESHKPGRDRAPFGTRVQGDAAHGGFRTVLTPFSLSQTTTPDVAIRLTRSVLSYFGVATGQYTVTSAKPLVYHTSLRFQVSGRETPVTAIVLGGRDRSTSLFHRAHGTATYTTVAMTPGAEPGSYVGVIPGSRVTPSGLDYYLRSGGKNGTFDPAPAASSALNHAIAVGIPEVG
jgi:M6 family metalloprotease-like protein